MSQSVAKIEKVRCDILLDQPLPGMLARCICASSALFLSAVPPLYIHALHKKPKSERCLVNTTPICEPGGQTIRQIAQTGDLHENTDSLREIARSEDQVTDHEAKTAEEDQG